MLLTSVILVLRETIEAALLVSILAAVSRHLRRDMNWMPLAVAIGIPLALLYAANMRAISGWFGYVGQEIVNTSLQVSIAAAVAMLTWLMTSATPDQKRAATAVRGRHFGFCFFCATLAVALAITREGAEIAMYVSGFLLLPEKLQPVLMGSIIGAAIGISVGVLVYYGIIALSYRVSRYLLLALLAMFCGNMLAQAARQLTQVDLLPAGPPLWDSSAWLPEDSIPGQLLYAFVGYESTPSAIEVCAYLFGVAFVSLIAYAGGRRQ